MSCFFCFFLVFMEHKKYFKLFQRWDKTYFFVSSKTIFWCNLSVYGFLFGFKVNQSFLIRLCHNVRIPALVGIKQITFYFWDKNTISLFHYQKVYISNNLNLSLVLRFSLFNYKTTCMFNMCTSLRFLLKERVLDKI